jgi:nitroreductase
MECVLCTETSYFFGLTKCEHRSVCSLCWYRLRAIMKKNSCPVCREECEAIFIVSDPSTPYNAIYKTAWGDNFPGYIHEELSNLYFKDKNELNRLLDYRKLLCKICITEFKLINLLKSHYQNEHGLKVCELCIDSNKLFMLEQELYTERDYKVHKTTSHVKCNVCNCDFYDGTQLVAHIKASHHFCDYCPLDKRIAFANYGSLEAHYKQNHYFCGLQGCKESQHIVFVKYEEFQEHYKNIHPRLSVPGPHLGFKVLEEEKNQCVFEDNPRKNNREPQPSQPSQADNLDFPALAPPSTVTNVLDYSRVLKKPTNNFWAHPQPQRKQKEEKKPKKSQKKPENKFIREDSNWENPYKELRRKLDPVATLEKYINKLNSGKINVDTFVWKFNNKNLSLDTTAISSIRNKIFSNSDREKIIYFLQNPEKSYEKKYEKNIFSFSAESPDKYHIEVPIPVKITEQQKVNRFKNPYEELEIPEKPTNYTNPVEEDKYEYYENQYEQPFVHKKTNIPKDVLDTLYENIVILNNHLIDANLFTATLKEFVSDSYIEEIISILSENIVPASRSIEIINMLTQKPKTTTLNPQYPQVFTRESNEDYRYNPRNLKIPNRDYEKTLKENIELLNLRIITPKELGSACIEIIPANDYDYAFKIIRKNVKVASISEAIIKELIKSSNKKSSTRG